MNENRFDGKGNLYASSRPNYPDSLFAYLKETKILTNGSTVADVGAGTGIFSVQLLSIAKTVFAVEPNDSMRAAALTEFKGHDRVIPVCASAEHTTLDSHSVDCVAAAQAFHWFDRDAFKTECRRILKPMGHVILVWNDRNTDSEIVKRNAEINYRFCTGYKGYSSGVDVTDRQLFSRFFQGDFDDKLFDNPLVYDLDTFIARNLSSSYAPKKGDIHYEGYISALTALFHERSCSGKILYPYITRCYSGTV